MKTPKGTVVEIIFWQRWSTATDPKQPTLVMVKCRNHNVPLQVRVLKLKPLSPLEQLAAQALE